MPSYTALITPKQLQALSDVFIVDCSHELSNRDTGPQAYAQGHIPGAHFLHVDDDLAARPNGRNGRHPLPEPDAFAAKLAARGLRHGQQVVVYDRSQGCYAGRLWWMLRWLGHDAVAVLDGGWQAWLADGGASTQDVPAEVPGDFRRGPSKVGSVTAEQVMANLSSGEKLVVDARSLPRYAGEVEPIDRVGGHIPGAVCRFFGDNLTADGRFKPAEQLRSEFEAVLAGRRPQDVIAQCGSGVSACHNLLAMAACGLDGALLYPGSWSEWCSDPARPVARGRSPQGE